MDNGGAFLPCGSDNGAHPRYHRFESLHGTAKGMVSQISQSRIVDLRAGQVWIPFPTFPHVVAAII